MKKYEYEEDFLLQKIKRKPKMGDIVRIAYNFGTMSNTYNDILITDDEHELLAIWYDGEYKGKNYKILDYQIITDIIYSGIDIEDYFENIENKTIVKQLNDNSIYAILNENGNVELIIESNYEGMVLIEKAFKKSLLEINNELISKGYVKYEDNKYFIRNNKTNYWRE